MTKYKRRRASTINLGDRVRVFDFILMQLGYEKETKWEYPKVHGEIDSIVKIDNDSYKIGVKVGTEIVTACYPRWQEFRVVKV